MYFCLCRDCSVVCCTTGGWTWGQCIKESQYSDRRWQMTVLDHDNYLYILGGEEPIVNSTSFLALNDVWKSTIPFTLQNKQRLQRACNIQFPTCTTGLSCLPGVATTKLSTDSAGRIKVSCPLLSECELPSDNGDGGDGTLTGEYATSTGGSSSGSSGLSTGAIALIAVVVIAAVVLIGIYFYYKHRSPAIAQPIKIDTRHLLELSNTTNETNDQNSSSTDVPSTLLS